MAGRFADMVAVNGELDTYAVAPDADWIPANCESALEECYAIIYALAEGDTVRISATLHGLGFDDPWADGTRAPMSVRKPEPPQVDNRNVARRNN